MTFITPPPKPTPKQRNTIWRLWDSPLYRDWAFWSTLTWAAIAAAAISTSKPPSGMSVWLNTTLATITFALLFGVLPTWIRLKLRQWHWNKQQKIRRHSGAQVMPGQTASEPSSTPSNQPHSARPMERDDTNRRKAGTSIPSPVGGEEQGSTPANGSHPQASISTVQPLPYPLAHAIRAFRVAITPEDQYVKLMAAADTLTICLGITAAAMFKSLGLGSQKLSSLQRSYCGIGVTQGAWKKTVDALADYAIIHPDVLPSAVSALMEGDGTVALTSDLETLLLARNHHAHGGYPRDKHEAELRVSSLRPALERAISRAHFLASTPWIVIETCSLQRHSADFKITAKIAMGENPEFDRTVFKSKIPLADDSLYIFRPQGTIELSPFIISRYCDSCRRVTLFYADRILKNSETQFKCFDRGHDTFDSETTAEIKSISS